MKALLTLALAMLTLAPALAGGPTQPLTVTPQADEKVTWYTLEQAQELAKKKPKKIFIDVYTDWCGWCKVMDKKTFSQPGIAKYLNEHYYPVKLNAEQTANIIFRGQVYGFNQARGTHDVVFALISGQFGYPTTVYLDEKLNVLQHISSYLDPKQFEPIIRFYGENAYKKTPWEQYQKTFKSGLE